MKLGNWFFCSSCSDSSIASKPDNPVDWGWVNWEHSSLAMKSKQSDLLKLETRRAESKSGVTPKGGWRPRTSSTQIGALSLDLGWSLRGARDPGLKISQISWVLDSRSDHKIHPRSSKIKITPKIINLRKGTEDTTIKDWLKPGPLQVINSYWQPILYHFGFIAAYCSNFGHCIFERHLINTNGDVMWTRSNVLFIYLLRTSAAQCKTYNTHTKNSKNY